MMIAVVCGRTIDDSGSSEMRKVSKQKRQTLIRTSIDNIYFASSVAAEDKNYYYEVSDDDDDDDAGAACPCDCC
jgi:hypothetical protein